MELEMKDKVVLVTGASSGIGKAVAIRAAKEGAHLVLVSRNAEALQKLAVELNSQYQTDCLVVKCDVSVKEQLDLLVKKVMDKYQRIDYLINSAGYGTFKEATEFTYEEIVAMYQVNTFAMIYLSNLVAELMKNQSSGHIFLISSIAGKMSTPASSIYSSTKAAVISYANALRLELKKDMIKVTTVNPGPVSTAFFTYDDTLKSYYQRVKKFTIKPEDVANKIVDTALNNSNCREINMPAIMSVAATFYQNFPKLGDFFALNIFNLK